MARRHKAGRNGKKKHRKMPLAVLEHFAHKTLKRLEKLGGKPQLHSKEHLSKAR